MRTRMTQEEIQYSKKRRMWFDTVYPLLKTEELNKDQIAKLATKISELALHLIETENDRNGNTKTTT